MCEAGPIPPPEQASSASSVRIHPISASGGREPKPQFIPNSKSRNFPDSRSSNKGVPSYQIRDRGREAIKNPGPGRPNAPPRRPSCSAACEPRANGTPEHCTGKRIRLNKPLNKEAFSVPVPLLRNQIFALVCPKPPSLVLIAALWPILGRTRWRRFTVPAERNYLIRTGPAWVPHHGRKSTGTSSQTRVEHGGGACVFARRGTFQ